MSSQNLCESEKAIEYYQKVKDLALEREEKMQEGDVFLELRYDLLSPLQKVAEERNDKGEACMHEYIPSFLPSY